MTLITKNFRLNALANQYSAAIFDHLKQQNGGEWFPMTVNGKAIEVAITDGVAGVRMLVDSYLLEAIKEGFPQWEDLAIKVLTRCVKDSEPTARGLSTWQNMINDMSATLSASEGHFNA